MAALSSHRAATAHPPTADPAHPPTADPGHPPTDDPGHPPTADPGTAGPARPDVLSYPSPTTSRYLIFVAALVAAGLFVGNYVHGMVWGDGWLRVVTACQGSTAGLSSDLLAQTEAFTACTAEVERTRTLVMWSGTLAVLLAAALLMWGAPLVVVRRRRLRPLPEALSAADARFHELARAAGVEGRVAPLLGSTSQRDGFSFGAPGRYRVALPPAAVVRWRDPSIFDPLVTHELAHVRHRDVALAWLTRTVWWVLVPLLAVPVVVGVVEQDYSILGGYLWRVALLALAVALLSRALLRSREHGADLRAAQLLGGPSTMLALIERLRQPATSRADRLLALHPRPTERRAVLENPVRFARTGALDGLTGGFLAMLAMPLVVASLIPLLAPLGGSLLGYVSGAAVLGPMLGGSVGLGLWRSALLARVGAEPVPVLQVAVGAGAGLVLGQAVSLRQVGLGTLTGTADPAWLLVTGAAGAGAVVLSLSLGHLWAGMTPRLRHARTAWLVALLVNSLLFGTVLWACTQFQSAVELGGWPLTRQALLSSTLSSWGVTVVVVLLAAFAVTTLAGRVRAGSAPGWLLAGEDRPWPGAPPLLRGTVLVSLGAGAAGTGALAAYRWLAGPGAGLDANLQRFQTYQWLAALAGAAVLLAMVVLDRRRGAGAALAGGPLAVLTVAVGFLALNTALGGRPDPAMLAGFVRPALALWLYVCLLLAPLAALVTTPWRTGAAVDVPPTVAPPVLARVLAVGLAGALAVAGASVALTGRDVLVGPVEQAELVPEDGPDDDLATFALATELAGYEDAVAGPIEQTYATTSTRAQEVLGDTSLTVEARRALLTQDVLEPLRTVAATSEAWAVTDPRMAALHDEARAGLDLALQRYTLLAEGDAWLDQAEVDALVGLQEQELARWTAWQEQRRAVFEEVRPLLEELGG